MAKPCHIKKMSETSAARRLSSKHTSPFAASFSSPAQRGDRIRRQLRFQRVAIKPAANIPLLALVRQYEDVAPIRIGETHMINLREASLGSDHPGPTADRFRVMRKRPVHPAAR